MARGDWTSSVASEAPAAAHVTMRIPPSLRRFVDGKAAVPVIAGTVRQALDALIAGRDDLRHQLQDNADQLHRFVRVFVDGQPVVIGASNDRAVPPGGEVRILLALAGG